MINELNQTTFTEGVNNDLCMVDFYSTSCGPCRALIPTLEKLSTEYSIHKVNVSENIDLAQQSKISAVPTLIFYKGGKEMGRLRGLQSEQTLRDTFAKLSQAE